MRQYEQDWLELGFRVAKALHYQHRRNLVFVQAAQAEARRTALDAQEWTHPETANALRPKATGPQRLRR
jgi:hypothetical protein